MNQIKWFCQHSFWGGSNQTLCISNLQVFRHRRLQTVLLQISCCLVLFFFHSAMSMIGVILRKIARCSISWCYNSLDFADNHFRLYYSCVSNWYKWFICRHFAIIEATYSIKFVYSLSYKKKKKHSHWKKKHSHWTKKRHETFFTKNEFSCSNYE